MSIISEVAKRWGGDFNRTQIVCKPVPNLNKLFFPRDSNSFPIIYYPDLGGMFSSKWSKNHD